MKREWIRETARDFLGLASVPFLVITVVRVVPFSVYYPLEFIIASAIFFTLKVIFKAELHAGLGFILAAFTSIFYNKPLFTAFALILYLGIIVSLLFLERGKKEIIKGVLFGELSTVITYFLVTWIFFG
ncbi:MAG: hypothetical protein PHH69_06640 [Candidatus Omnitrophica bacterium]|nr:hypothetical protein [Candidatus Omnitrophota bacterium]